MHELAARVALLKARKESLSVELREYHLAFAGVRGRLPSAEEVQLDGYPMRLASEGRAAAEALADAQRALAAAQAREREAIEASRQAAAARRLENARRTAEEKETAAAAAAQRDADVGLLVELMRVGERRLATSGSVLLGASSDGGGALAAADGGGVGGGAGGGGLGDGWLVQNQLLTMMETLSSKLDSMQLKQDEMQAENEKLRASAAKAGAAAAGGRRRGGTSSEGGGAGGDDDDDDDDGDKAIVTKYHDAASSVMTSLATGRPPSAAAYAERDVQMYRLPDDELRAEYERYTQLYLDERTSAGVRGMAEMTLIKVCGRGRLAAWAREAGCSACRSPPPLSRGIAHAIAPPRPLAAFLCLLPLSLGCPLAPPRGS